MTEQAEHYRVEPKDDAWSFEFLRNIDPTRFWSDRVLDEILDECCVIHERLGGALEGVWRRGLAAKWNLCVARLTSAGRDLGKQLSDRSRTIRAPITAVQPGSLVLHEGVTWAVQQVEQGRVSIVRDKRRQILQGVRHLRVVIRSRVLHGIVSAG